MRIVLVFCLSMLVTGSSSVEPACRIRGSIPEMAKLFLEVQRLIAAETDGKILNLKDETVQLRKDLLSAKLDSESKMVALKGQMDREIFHLKMMHGQEINDLKNSSEWANAAVSSLKAELLAVRANMKTNLDKTGSEIDLVRNQTAENSRNLRTTRIDVNELREGATNTTGGELEDRTVQIENRVLSLENDQSNVNSSISVIQEDQIEMTTGLTNLKNKLANSLNEVQRNTSRIHKTQDKYAVSFVGVAKDLDDVKKRVDAIEKRQPKATTPSPSLKPRTNSTETPSTTGVPSGFTKHSDGAYYKLSDNELTWTAAKQSCESLGATLAIDDTAMSHEAIKTAMGDEYQVWLGATDELKEGEWRYMNGKKLSVDYWRAGLPDGGLRDNCMEMYGKPHGSDYKWKWVDYLCTYSFRYVCQYRLTK